jgi:hypothetical protein
VASTPGCDPGLHRDGTAATFDMARASFDVAWQALLPTRAEADFRAWRDQRDWTARKYAGANLFASRKRSPAGRS